MCIGVPAEIKANGQRVALVPSSVKELTAKGHNLYVETGAGPGWHSTAFARSGHRARGLC